MTKSPARHRGTWWCIDVNNSVTEKCKRYEERKHIRLSESYPFSGVSHFIHKAMIEESICKMKKGLVPEMVKSAGDARVDPVRNLINKTLVEVIPVSQNLRTIVNSWGKGDALDSENYRGLEEWLVKLIKPVLKNVRDRASVNCSFRDDFLVPAGLN